MAVGNQNRGNGPGGDGDTTSYRIVKRGDKYVALGPDNKEIFSSTNQSLVNSRLNEARLNAKRGKGTTPTSPVRETSSYAPTAQATQASEEGAPASFLDKNLMPVQGSRPSSVVDEAMQSAKRGIESSAGYGQWGTLYADQAGPRADGSPQPILGPDLRPVQPTPTAPYGQTADAPTPDTVGGVSPGVDDSGGDSGGGTNVGKRIGGGFRLTSPEWAWEPTQADFGQVDPYAFQMGTGMVPVARSQMPFPALANRMQANAQRRAQHDAKVAAYDPYSKVGKAHERYQVAYNKWATGWIDEQRQKLANDMFRGDMRQTDEYLATTPEGQRMLVNWGRTTESVGMQNKEVVDASIELLADVTKGDLFLPEEHMRYLTETVNALGPDGMPVRGVDAQEFLRTSQEAYARIQEAQYIHKKFAPIVEKAFKTITGKPIKGKWVNGKLEMDQTKTKTFEDALNYLVNSEDGQDYVETFHGGDKDEALNALRAFYPTSEEVKSTFVGAPSKGGRGDGGGGGGKIKTSASWLPIRTVDEATGKTIPGEGTIQVIPYKGAAASIGNVEVFSGESDDKGRQISNPRLVYRPGKKNFVILGELLDYKTVEKIEIIKEKIKEAQSDEERDRLDRQIIELQKTAKKEYQVNASFNSALLEQLYGSKDPYEIYANLSGMKVDEVKRLIKTVDGRRQIGSAMGIPEEALRIAGGSASAQKPVGEMTDEEYQRYMEGL